MALLGRRLFLFAAGVALAGVAAVGPDSATAEEPTAASDATLEPLVVSGVTRPSPGRVSEIAACVMHPVERVFVKPGDVVRAGQPLVELDSDEARAEVRAKQAQVAELTSTVARLRAMPRAEERQEARAQLESAQIALRASEALLRRLESLRAHHAVSERDFIDQQTVVRRAAADERAAQAHLDYLLKLPIEHEIAEAEHQLAAAKAELEAAEFEVEHYTIPAAIDGIVCWLDVTPGTVHRAGAKVWGEIVDLREVDVLVELTPRQLREIDFTRPIHVRHADLERSRTAQFVFAAPAANRQTGLIPVTLRVSGDDDPLHCHLNVSVTFARTSMPRPSAAQNDTLAVENRTAK